LAIYGGLETNTSIFSDCISFATETKTTPSLPLPFTFNVYLTANAEISGSFSTTNIGYTITGVSPKSVSKFVFLTETLIFVNTSISGSSNSIECNDTKGYVTNGSTISRINFDTDTDLTISSTFSSGHGYGFATTKSSASGFVIGGKSFNGSSNDYYPIVDKIIFSTETTSYVSSVDSSLSLEGLTGIESRGNL